MKFDTIKDAAHAWVHEMNEIPIGVVEKLMQNDEVTEITPAAVGDVVSFFMNGRVYDGEIVKDLDEDTFVVHCYDDGEDTEVQKNDVEVKYDSYLPMWGTMWTFGDTCDDWWLEENGGLQIMADCGFRIYEQEDFGYIFGIDGAGYDFYESHWIPLYKARGLHWHKEEGEN